MDKRASVIQDIVRREESVFGYQLNIDNFKLGIELISKHHSRVQHMMEFRKTLERLLSENIIEQDKEKLMLQVARIQLEEIDRVRED